MRGLGAEPGGPPRVERQVAQRLGQPRGVAARDEHAVDAVGHHVAVAGDVGCDDRAAGRERLGEHHAERLAAERRRAQQVGAHERGVAGGVVDPPERVMPSPSCTSGAISSAVEPDDRQLGGNLGAQRLEGAQEHGQALALDGLADERDPQRLARRPGRGPGTPPAGSATPFGTTR